LVLNMAPTTPSRPSWAIRKHSGYVVVKEVHRIPNPRTIGDEYGVSDLFFDDSGEILAIP
jgi:hypothetical protein